jgi:two-component system CheB/CheR fusion protein
MALSTGRMGLAEMDIESRTTIVDTVLAEQLNLPGPGMYPAEEIRQFIPVEDQETLDQSLDQAIQHGQEYELDFRVDVPGEELRFIRTRGFTYHTKAGHQKVIAPTVDVTVNQQQTMLSHRIKNLFAVISGLVQAAPKAEAETKLLADELIGKIASLGAVYDLARKDPAMPGIDLRELLIAVLKPHTLGQSIELKGPNVFVDQDALNTLTIIFHELATNAIKHGGLSVPEGKLRVSWSKNAKGLTKLCWRETVPGFTRPDADDLKGGFGSRLIATSIRQLRGGVKNTWTKTGAKIDLTLELSKRES